MRAEEQFMNVPRNTTLWMLMLTSVAALLITPTTVDAQIRRPTSRRTAHLPNYEEPLAPSPRARALGLPGTNGQIMLYNPDRRLGVRNNAFGSAVNRTSRASDTSLTLFRKNLLLRDTGFASPVSRIAVGVGRPSPMDMPTQEQLDRAIEQMMNLEPSEVDYSAILARQMVGKQQRYIRDGFGYLKDGDLIRAAGAFDAAEVANRKHPYPRFGKLILDVLQEHYASATTRLVTIMKYDAQRDGRIPGMFEYDLQWRDYFEDEEDLRETIRVLRQFTQKKLEKSSVRTQASVQALYCYVLWYSGFEEARVEARNVAAGIARSYPSSTWARMLTMIINAEEKAKGQTAGDLPSVPQAG